MKAVIGLGNPGPTYEGTRHNIGYAVIDYLAGRNSFRAKYSGLVTEIVEPFGTLLLVKPTTFMNLSGKCVRELADFHKMLPGDLLVVCDDLALPLGKLRMRESGSHGGQNGLRNIQERLATNAFPRLRIGIGAPSEHQDAADFVLSRFRAGERAVAEDAIATAAQAVLLWARDGATATMNRINGGPAEERPKPVKKKAPEKPNEPKPTDG